MYLTLIAYKEEIKIPNKLGKNVNNNNNRYTKIIKT